MQPRVFSCFQIKTDLLFHGQVLKSSVATLLLYHTGFFFLFPKVVLLYLWPYMIMKLELRMTFHLRKVNGSR